MAKRIGAAKSKAADFDVSFTVQVWKENGTHIAYTPELDVSSCGKSVREAISQLRKAVSLFLEEASRMGTLENIFAEAGFERHGKTYSPHRVIVREKVRLAVPIAS